MVKKGKKQKKISVPQTSKMNIMKGVGRYRNRNGIRKLKGKGGYAEDIGSSIGSWLGKKAGGLFKSITGLGTYAVTSNSLMANPNDPPVLSNTRGGTRIQHREYITDITGSTAFTLTPYAINPGVAATFPWLSGCALNFEEYILHGLVFEFKSTSATALNSTNTALGTVIMATEYNVVNPNFTAKRDMENYVYSTSCSPDVSALHPVECARDVNVLSELFIRNTVPPSGTDLRFSDIGKFQIATVGMQASAVIGELWVTYDVELIKPRLPNAYTSIGPAHYVYDASSGIPPVGSAPTDTNLFGVKGVNLALQGTGNTPVTLDVNTMTFTSPGRYLVNFYLHRSTSAITYPTLTLSSTVTAASIFTVGGAATNINNAPDPAGPSSALVNVMYAFDVSSALATVPATVSFASSTFGTIGSLQLLIIPLPVGFTVTEKTDLERLTDTVNTLTKRLERLTVLTDSDDDCDIKENYIHQDRPVDMSQSQIYRQIGASIANMLTPNLPPPNTPSKQNLSGLP